MLEAGIARVRCGCGVADRAITINFWGLGNPNYLMPFLDAMGSEGNLKGNGQGPN